MKAFKKDYRTTEPLYIQQQKMKKEEKGQFQKTTQQQKMEEETMKKEFARVKKEKIGQIQQ